MYYIKFCRAPSGYWVGCLTYQNGVYWASGNTMDDLHKHMCKRMYNEGRIPTSSIIIDSRQSLPSEMPVEKMGKAFKTRYWYEKDSMPESTVEVVKKERKTRTKKAPANVVETPIKYDGHTYKTENGKLIVYGIVKIAEYDLYENNNVTPDVTPQENTDTEQQEEV